MTDPGWHYTVEGETQGPFSPEEFKALAQQGAIGPETLVWREGLDGWQPLKNFTKPAPSSVMPPASTEPKRKCDYCGLEFAGSKLQKHGASLICATCLARIERINPGGSQPKVEHEFAGFLPRAGAALIDVILLLVINGILTSACSCLAPNPKESLTKVMAFLMIMAFRFLLSTIVGIGYFTYMVGAHEGTLGKILLGLRVIRSDGSPVTYLRSLGRYWGQVLGALSLTLAFAIFILFFDLPIFISMFLVWVLLALFIPIKMNLQFFSDFECRTLHDRLCDTRVVLRSR